jgi:hypothetical protein
MSGIPAPNERARASEQADTRSLHQAHREPTKAEAADAAAGKLVEAERRSVAAHEQDMARRGVEQSGKAGSVRQEAEADQTIRVPWPSQYLSRSRRL